MSNEFQKLENDDMIEIHFIKDKPHIVGNFKFIKDDTTSHPTSFRKWKKISFSFPVLILF